MPPARSAGVFWDERTAAVPISRTAVISHRLERTGDSIAAPRLDARSLSGIPVNSCVAVYRFSCGVRLSSFSIASLRPGSFISVSIASISTGTNADMFS